MPALLKVWREDHQLKSTVNDYSTITETIISIALSGSITVVNRILIHSVSDPGGILIWNEDPGSQIQDSAGN